VKNNVIIIVDGNGSLLSEPIGQLRANANYTVGITVLAPFDLTTVVSANFKKNNRREKDEANYLIPTSYKGKDIITDVNHPLYQKVYNYNVWENILTDDATAYIATFTADMLYASIGFGIKQTPALATNYLGEFGIGIPLPLGANNGDYLISNSYNYYQGGINYTLGDYAYWYNDEWNKSNYIGIAGTDSFPLSVSPNIKANYEITENVDLSVLLAGRVAILEQEVNNLYNTKQDKLIAGENITIEDNVISAVGGSSGGYEPDNITIGLNAEQKLEVKDNLEIDGGFL
jgi:hypothetical protein